MINDHLSCNEFKLIFFTLTKVPSVKENNDLPKHKQFGNFKLFVKSSFKTNNANLPVYIERKRKISAYLHFDNMPDLALKAANQLFYS